LPSVALAALAAFERFVTSFAYSLAESGSFRDLVPSRGGLPCLGGEINGVERESASGKRHSAVAGVARKPHTTL
jgi:hypothetical protein